MIANIVKIIILGEHKICIDGKSFLARNEYQANFLYLEYYAKLL